MKNVIRPSYDLYINGRWVPSSDGSTFKAINPANGEVLSVCAEATQDDVNAAVRAARLPSRPGRTYRPENDRPSS